MVAVVVALVFGHGRRHWQFVLAGRAVSLAPGVSLDFEVLPNSFDVWFYATDNGSPPASDVFVLTVNVGGACHCLSSESPLAFFHVTRAIRSSLRH